MLKILLATDGSPQALHAAERAIRLHQTNGPIELHLLNVQIPVASGHARMFVGQEDLDTYYQDEGRQAVEEVRSLLDAAGVPYQVHIEVGPVAETIADCARRLQCDQIMMGTHGRGALTHLLLGSVATDVIRASAVPVLLVK